MQEQEKSKTENSVRNLDRRKAIKKIATGVGLLVGGSVLPEKWIKPVVGFVALPAHAETSGGITKIVALGDSIGARSPNWPSVVQSKSGTGVSNYSQDSLKTGDFVGRLDSILASEMPSHLMILLGTNNARAGQESEAISDLQAMASMAIEQNVVVIIGTVPPILTSSSHNSAAARISDGISGIGGIRVADVRNSMGDGSGLFEDGIHPNANGTDIIASAFLSQLY